MTIRRFRNCAIALGVASTLSVAGTSVRAAAAAVKQAAASSDAEVVVKLAPESGANIADVARDYRLRVVKDVLASHGIYLMAITPTAPGSKAKPPKPKELADRLSKDARLSWAEPNFDTDASDDRFHAWPEGFPNFVGTDPALWLGQPAAVQLGLDEAHRLSTGAGVVVAVLDTGVDRNHPALAGRLDPAWDYVDDDPDPTDSPDNIDNDGDGLIDEAYGHGTHVAGIVALVAPDARILPARVLNADGRGNVFAVAAAIDDVVDAGANVINLSFGTEDNTTSKVLNEAIVRAQHAGVAVVASSGNGGSDVHRFPAALKDVFAVAGTDAADTGLAGFSNRGNWVAAAAPATAIVSAVPGGGYASWSGTSMAAPFVSGQIALIHSRSPRSTAKQVRDDISHTAHKLNGKPAPGAVDILASLQRL